MIERCKSVGHGFPEVLALTTEIIEEIVATLSSKTPAEDKLAVDTKNDVYEAYSDSDSDIFDTLSVMSVETAITSASGYGTLTQSATIEFLDLLYEAVDIHALAQPRLEANA